MYRKILFEVLDKNSKNFVGTIFNQDDLRRINNDTSFALALGMPVSTACNLKCKFCYTDTHNNRNSELSLEERLNLLDQAKEIGIKTIMTAMSGEAFCDPNFFKILKYSKNLGFDYFLFTNLTMITKDIAEKLHSYNVGILGSCHSIRENVYEDLTQIKGTYKKMMQGAENLLEAGYSTQNFVISWVVSKKNYDEYEDMINFWLEKGIKVFPEYGNITGCANNFIDELYLSYDEYLKLRETINSKFEGYNSIPPLTYDNQCFSGMYGIIVGIDGIIYRCWDPGKTGIIGNIREMTLKEAVDIKYRNPCFCPGYDECVGRNSFLKNR
jgi:MoaA/NifB/PqqE/SkfB family radical SAM enzyme